MEKLAKKCPSSILFPQPVAVHSPFRLDWHRSVFGGWTAAALFDFEAGDFTAGQLGVLPLVRLRLPGAHFLYPVLCPSNISGCV